METKEGIYFSAFDNRLFTFDKSIDIGINASRCLNLLIENKDCVVSKDQILQICWVANGIYVSDASIRQTIVKLRKAFSEVGLYGEYIKTIPKIGYRYSGDIIPVNKGDECPALSCETSSLNSENVPLHRPPGSATKKETRLPYSTRMTTALSIAALIISTAVMMYTQLNLSGQVTPEQVSYDYYRSSGDMTYYIQSGQNKELAEQAIRILDKYSTLAVNPLKDIHYIYINRQQDDLFFSFYGCKSKLSDDFHNCKTYILDETPQHVQ